MLSPTASALDGLVLRNDTGWYQLGSVVLVDMASGEQRTVVPGGGCFGFCFSPDGTQIAFWRAGSIYTVRVDGSDLQKVCDTTSRDYAQQYLSWTHDDYIYWSEQTPNIYRVSVSNGGIETVHTSKQGDVQLAKVSLDGKRAGFTSTASGTWRAWAVDLVTHREREIGEGCQATAAPDGTLLTHNLPGHQQAKIHRFSDLSVYTVINKPTDRVEFDMHEFSHSSNKHVVYTCDRNYAYVHDIDSDTAYFAGRGAPFDFRPNVATGVVLGLNPDRLTFHATINRAAPNEQSITISSTGGKLDAVQAATDAAWLEVSVSDIDGRHTIRNAVTPGGMPAGRYQAVVSVTAGNAVNSPRVYAVELILDDPSTGPSIEVDAGADLVVSFGDTVKLTGVISPSETSNGKVTVTMLWSQSSGPGQARFSEPSALSTEVTFSNPGIYVLRLTAIDGELKMTDELAVTVRSDGSPRILIDSPVGGETWEVGSQQRIRWSAENLDDVTIRYYEHEGDRQLGLIASSIDRDNPQWGDVSWSVPDTPCADCVIQISGYFYEAPTLSGTFSIVRPADDGAENQGRSADAGVASTPATRQDRSTGCSVAEGRRQTDWQRPGLWPLFLLVLLLVKRDKGGEGTAT